MKKTSKTPQQIFNIKTKQNFKYVRTLKRQGEILEKLHYEKGLRALKNIGDYGYLIIDFFVQGKYALSVNYKFTKIEKYLYEVEHFTYNETETSDNRKFYILKNGRRFHKYDNLEDAMYDMNFMINMEILKKNI